MEQNNMPHRLIDRDFYEAVISFDESEAARDHYYEVMGRETGRLDYIGRNETVKGLILRVYAMLFCDDMDMPEGMPAGPYEVEETADRLYIGEPHFDPDHWYRMKYHFPVIDEDNYARFAALVISDLKCGPLHDSALRDGETLILGEANPLKMTSEERAKQRVKKIEGGGELI